MNQNNQWPCVSIVTLNYNQLAITCEFLDSTIKISYPNYEIIVVDNASKEDPTAFIQNRYPHVRIIRNEQNLGFSGGNNVGIRAAVGDFYFIVNNDTEVTPNLIEELLKPFALNPLIGIVSPKIRYFSHPNLIQYAGYNEINPYTGRNQSHGAVKEDKGQYDNSSYTAYAHGAAMMVKKEVVEKVGMLPELFFIYYEELDWSAHIRRAGFKIYYQASALIYHKESMTMGKESVMKTYFQNRNRILFMRRNSSPGQFLLFIWFLIGVVIPSRIFRYTIRGQFTHLNFFIKAMLWNLNGADKTNLSAIDILKPITNGNK